ncbi:hypothetical protein C4K38_1566 [Pseudomonas chlororaphis subsp. piscium]|nr:hypothetical protein C4K38_1566 [Pseudomonas chlororaphis subsp. piscium]
MQVQAAVTGDQAIVAPVAATAFEAVGGQQLSTGAAGAVGAASFPGSSLSSSRRRRCSSSRRSWRSRIRSVSPGVGAA